MCPSCNSSDISRSRKKKLIDAFMRWMGQTPYRCRDCQKRFYVNSSLDRRLRKDLEWRRKAGEHGQKAPPAPAEEAEAEDLV